jgi:hypothetical protein
VSFRPERGDGPTEPGAGPPDRSALPRDELRQRLERLADGHPSSDSYRTGDHSRPGWQAPDVRDHPDRPPEADIHLSPDRGRHILDGDGARSPGGGHRHGTGRPGKTEFPASWPDEVILPLVEEITRTPDAVERQRNGKWLVTAERHEVRVTAVVLADGRIWTAWPEPGGPGVRQNPKEGQA